MLCRTFLYFTAVEQMSQSLPTPLARELARRVLRHETGDGQGAESLAAAAERACAGLRGQLAPLIGAVGFAALFDRALRLARADDPALAPLALAEGPERCLEGARAFAAGREPAEVAAGLAAAFAHLFHLLHTLIGEDLTAGLVRRAWPDLAGDESDPHPETPP